MSYTIRPTIERDAPELMAISKEFSDLLGLEDINIEYDARSALETIEFVIHSPLAVALTVCDDESGCIAGTIAGIISPWLLNKGAQTLQELWFYLRPAYRTPRLARNLMAAFEAYGRKAGATHCIMGTHLHARERALDRFYKATGYKHLEHHYVREL